MNVDFILKLLPQPTFIIIISTFAGSLIGEFYREVNDDVPCSLDKFLAKFLASWIIGLATIFLFKGVLDIKGNEKLISLSIFFSFIGHKASLTFMEKFITNKIKD